MSFHDPPDPAPEPEQKPRTSTLRRLSLASTVLVAVFVAFALNRDATSAALIFIGILVFLVVAHEFAHFATAKMYGIKVLEFGIGFPPRMAGFRYGETEYTVNWLPLGGFVRLLGEEDPDDPRSLAAAPRMHRFVVLVSGSLMNLVLPVLLFAVAYTIPHDEQVGRAVIATVVPGAPAEAAGFEPGDVIYEIGGRDARNAGDAGRLIRLNLGEEIEVRVRRGQEFITLTVVPRWSPPEGQGPTGITIYPQCTVVGGYGCVPFTERVADPPWVSIPRGFNSTVDSMILVRNEVLSWFRGGSSPEVAGPVGLAQTTGEVARAGGVTTLLQLAAILSINLGILNLLPLPMLDGGRVMFLFIEVLRGGRRVRPEREALVHLVGFVLFIALAAIVTYFDITRIANGESIFR